MNDRGARCAHNTRITLEDREPSPLIFIAGARVDFL